MVPSPAAALVNTTMAHAMDYDDTHDIAGLHAAISVFLPHLQLHNVKEELAEKNSLTAVTLGSIWYAGLGLPVNLL
jgi:hypothetical protein